MHRVRAARKTVEEVAHILVDKAALIEQTGKFSVLGVCRQFSVDKQICYINKNSVFDKFFDGVSAVTQNTVFSIDVGYFAVTACCIDKSGVKGDQSGTFAQT